MSWRVTQLSPPSPAGSDQSSKALYPNQEAGGKRGNGCFSLGGQQFFCLLYCPVEISPRSWTKALSSS